MLMQQFPHTCNDAAAAPAVLFYPTGVDIREDALQEVAGDSYTARTAAQRFGTDLNRQLFERQNQLMREQTQKFLRSDACANSQEPKPTAYMQYVVGMVQAGGWFCEEALWMAVYGAAFCAETVVEQVVPPAAAAAAAAAGSERRQQQQEQRQQQRKEKRRRHDEKARQQQRQQQRQQRYQQSRDTAAQLPADLAAAAPDVSSMKVAQLRAFLHEVRHKPFVVCCGHVMSLGCCCA
jgi:hypothetical protein